MRKKQLLPRRGSVYIAVTGTAVLVSLVGFTAIHLSRVELSRTTAQNERAYARQLAQTGVEFALGAIDLDSNWRSNYTHNVEVSKNPLGVDENVYFRFLDNLDADLADDPDEPVEIQGIGRYGNATSIYSVTYARSITSSNQVGPLLIRSYSEGTSSSSNVGPSSSSGQYFIPNLPPEATDWSVTSVKVYLRGQGAANGTLLVNFYQANASGLPANLLESVAIEESLLPSGGYDWHQVNFNSLAGLTPGARYCLTLEGAGSGDVAVVPYNTGVTQTDSHKLNGSSGSWSSATSNSIQFHINGVYSTENNTGQFAITPGSWRSTEN